MGVTRLQASSVETRKEYFEALNKLLEESHIAYIVNIDETAVGAKNLKDRMEGRKINNHIGLTDVSPQISDARFTHHTTLLTGISVMLKGLKLDAEEVVAGPDVPSLYAFAGNGDSVYLSDDAEEELGPDSWIGKSEKGGVTKEMFEVS